MTTEKTLGAGESEPASDGSALIDAALNLESWLSSNVGDTADWPVHIHIDNSGDADALASLLTALAHAAKMYRQNNSDHLRTTAGRT